METVNVDLVKEFRLRKWARNNYVSTAQRSRLWHPIVLNEMTLMDGEFAECARVRVAGKKIFAFDQPSSTPAPHIDLWMKATSLRRYEPSLLEGMTLATEMFLG